MKLCSWLPHADPLRLSDILFFIDGKLPVQRDCLDTMHSTAAEAAGIEISRSGSTFNQGQPVAPALLHRAVESAGQCCRVHDDGKSPEAETFGLTFSVLALRRRLKRSTAPRPDQTIIQRVLKNGCTKDELRFAARATPSRCCHLRGQSLPGAV